MQIKNEGLNKKTEPDYIRLPYLQLLSKERLEKIASWRETYGAGHNVMIPAEEAEALARFALAGMEQEPVAWTDAEELRDLKRDGYAAMLSLSRKDCEHADPRRQILLFTHPAPSILAAPVAVPDEWSLNDAINFIEEMGTVSEAGAAQQAWNACRAAMHNGGGQ